MLQNNIFQNQVALVTGASGSIGEATAKLLHSLGAFVYLSGTNEEKLSNLSNELKDNNSILVCDLSNEQETSDLISKIDKLDILVANAGMTKDTLAIRMKNDDFKKVIDVNLTANFILNRDAIKKMLKQKYGRIINISSVVALMGNPGQANYTASKAGLIAMTKSLAKEVAMKNININVVAPGFIETNMTNGLSDLQREMIMDKIASKKFGKPQDVANIVAFLASPMADYITGQTINVNGGMLMV